MVRGEGAVNHCEGGQVVNTHQQLLGLDAK